MGSPNRKPKCAVLSVGWFPSTGRGQQAPTPVSSRRWGKGSWGMGELGWGFALHSRLLAKGVACIISQPFKKAVDTAEQCHHVFHTSFFSDVHLGIWDLRVMHISIAYQPLTSPLEFFKTLCLLQHSSNRCCSGNLWLKCTSCEIYGL